MSLFYLNPYHYYSKRNNITFLVQYLETAQSFLICSLIQRLIVYDSFYLGTLQITWDQDSDFHSIVSIVRWTDCCGNHQIQSPTITQQANLLRQISSGDFTRELNKEPLLNQSPIYTNGSWSILLINNPALMSILHPHSYLISYLRPPYVLQVP